MVTHTSDMLIGTAVLLRAYLQTKGQLGDFFFSVSAMRSAPSRMWQRKCRSTYGRASGKIHNGRIYNPLSTNAYHVM